MEAIHNINFEGLDLVVKGNMTTPTTTGYKGGFSYHGIL